MLSRERKVVETWDKNQNVCLINTNNFVEHCKIPRPIVYEIIGLIGLIDQLYYLENGRSYRPGTKTKMLVLSIQTTLYSIKHSTTHSFWDNWDNWFNWPIKLSWDRRVIGTWDKNQNVCLIKTINFLEH